MVIDLNKTGFENFLAMITAATNRVFDPKYILFSLPTPWSNPKYPAQNTVVTATAKPNGPYKGNTTFIYTRTDLSKVSAPLEIPYNPKIDYITLKHSLIDGLGLLYADVDFDVVTIPVPKAGQNTSFNIVAKKNSYLYTGQLKVIVTSGVPSNARLLEDGSLRLMEDGSVRLLEDTMIAA